MKTNKNLFFVDDLDCRLSLTVLKSVLGPLSRDPDLFKMAGTRNPAPA